MIYLPAVKSRTGSDIPLFKNLHPMHSKYNPEAEAEAFAATLKDGFIIIGGIGGGFHIKAVLSKFPDSFIVCVEADRESLEYSEKLNGNKSLCGEKTIFITADELENAVLMNYMPQVYNNLTLGFNRSWERENPETAALIKETVTAALAKVKADYSVQAWFSRQWHKNIMINCETQFARPELEGELLRTCAVIAAGPSLEKDAALLKDGRDGYYILATDTAYLFLLKSGIYADAVISTDCQQVSSSHFYSVQERSRKPALFVFDLCSPPCAVRQAQKKNQEIYFFQSGHPLSRTLFSDSVLSLSSGSGTVTAAAADFAFRCGFKKIEFFGADFSYPFGKPYARGTYLETEFMKASSRFENAETKYAALMFRTELHPQNQNEFSRHTANAPATDVLDSYRTSLARLLEKNGYRKNGRTFILDENRNRIKEEGLPLEKIRETKNKIRENPSHYRNAFLPLTAYLKRIHPEKSFEELCPIAYKYSGEYN